MSLSAILQFILFLAVAGGVVYFVVKLMKKDGDL
jgi:hypothetical protein